MPNDRRVAGKYCRVRRKVSRMSFSLEQENILTKQILSFERQGWVYFLMAKHFHDEYPACYSIDDAAGKPEFTSLLFVKLMT